MRRRQPQSGKLLPARSSEEGAEERTADEVLVQRVLEGHRRAFDELYVRYAPRVAVRLRRILWSTADVEDVLQATFVQVHRTLERYRPEASFNAWIHGIAFRVAGTHIRSQKRRRWLMGVDASILERTQLSDEPALDEKAADRQLLERTMKAMAKLSADKRIALVLHELEGLGLTEIASLVGATPQTIWARVQSARKKVKKEMERLDRELSNSSSRRRGS